MNETEAYTTFDEAAAAVASAVMGLEPPSPAPERVEEAANVLLAKYRAHGGTDALSVPDVARAALADSLDRWWAANRGRFTGTPRQGELLAYLEDIAGRPLRLS